MAFSLTIHDFGVSIGKRSERIVLRKKGLVLREVPFFRVSEIVVPERGVSISSDVIHEACERGIRIAFLRGGGRPFAMLSSPMMVATIETRRQQHAAFHDDRGVQLARAVVRGKLVNQARLLRYFGKYRRSEAPETFAAIDHAADVIEGALPEIDEVEAACVDHARETLLGLEGSAGRVYWSGVRSLLAGKVEFAGRRHPHAVDRVNALLNYGYGILYAQVWGAVLNAGLDPFAGFLHVDRPGKPSLVLDLVEEFRQPVVDRAVFAMIGQGREFAMEQGRLSDDARREVAAQVEQRLEEIVRFGGVARQVRSLVQHQVRQVASFLCRRRPAYRPYAFKW